MSNIAALVRRRDMIGFDLDAERELAARALENDCVRVAADAPGGELLAGLCTSTYRAALADGDAATWRDLWHLIAALVRTTANRGGAAYSRLCGFLDENGDLTMRG